MAEMQVAGIAQQEVRAAFVLHQLLHHRHQGQADVAQVDPASAPVEQLHAIVLFQLADAAGDRGLAYAQLLGGSGDAALPCHFIERRQQVAEHGGFPWGLRKRASLAAIYDSSSPRGHGRGGAAKKQG